MFFFYTSGPREPIYTESAAHAVALLDTFVTLSLPESHISKHTRVQAQFDMGIKLSILVKSRRNPTLPPLRHGCDRNLVYEFKNLAGSCSKALQKCIHSLNKYVWALPTRHHTLYRCKWTCLQLQEAPKATNQLTDRWKLKKGDIEENKKKRNQED
ncbi:hypothetical protein AMECASPLE_012016 [Ameca splendens]|uniref:Uncharacterized protein n=1 Tax=Ameca splendens TaxID=208324 RepID=A0ABV0Z0D8_9TELE